VELRLRPREVLAAAVAVLALAGCGGGGGANDVLSDSAKSLDDVRSGVLHLKLVIQPSGGAGSNPFGFALDGPFALGPTPLARMTYTQIANGTTGEAELVLRRDGGYVEANGVRTALTADQLQTFRATTKSAAEGGGLQVSEWATSAEERECDGGLVCVEGDLDPAKAVRGLIDLQQQLGASQADTDASDESLARVVRSSRYELAAASDDRQLRRLHMVVDFHADVPQNMRSTLGSFVGAKIDFDFSLQKANADVGLG
jgi:hypothetical protein